MLRRRIVGAEVSVRSHIKHEILIYFSYISHDRPRVKQLFYKLDLKQTGTDHQCHLCQIEEIITSNALTQLLVVVELHDPSAISLLYLLLEFLLEPHTTRTVADYSVRVEGMGDVSVL